MLAYQSLFIQCQIDFEWDQMLRLKDKEYKCGIENKFKNAHTSRIINGKETTNTKYPWMVQILRYIPSSAYNWPCGGTIISDKSILKEYP